VFPQPHPSASYATLDGLEECLPRGGAHAEYSNGLQFHRLAVLILGRRLARSLTPAEGGAGQLIYVNAIVTGDCTAEVGGDRISGFFDRQSSLRRRAACAFHIALYVCYWPIRQRQTPDAGHRLQPSEIFFLFWGFSFCPQRLLRQLTQQSRRLSICSNTVLVKIFNAFARIAGNSKRPRVRI